MGDSASTDTFPALPADVAEVRRASGITIAPEAALHRALQERTDELERVRAERDSALADLMESATCLEALEAERRTVLAMVEQHAGGSPRLVDEVRASLRSLAQDRDAAVDEVVRLVRERDEAQAALAEARAENASLLAVVPPGTHVARVEWGVHAEVTRQRDEILRLTRERDEARAACSELRQAVATIEAAYDRAVSERDEARAERNAARGRFDAMEAEVEVHRRAKASAVEAADRCEAVHGAVEEALQELANNLKHERDVARAERDAARAHTHDAALLVKEIRAQPAEALLQEARGHIDRLISECRARDAARAERDAALRELAETIDTHDSAADMFDPGDDALASVRAVVEEFLRAHGHPVADEWATRRFAPPTAPDVALPCAPAAGAADPPRRRTPDEIRAWSTGLFGG